jgi:polysaccharide export outer membrane protein
MLLIAAMANADRPATAETPKPGSAYLLQPGDEIAVKVFPRDEYSSTGIIPPDGEFPIRNVGGVKAAGATLNEFSERARKALETILKNPRVTVTLVKLGTPPAGPRITVIGAIAKPGALPLDEGLRLLKAIELAGGATLDADLTRVLVRHLDLKQQVIDLSDSERASDPQVNRLLLDGDSIEVPSKLKLRVTVTGAVTKPGALDGVEPGVRVAKAIDLTGGALKEADLTKVSILRDDQSRLIVDLSTPERLTDAGHNIVLRNGDSIEVPLAFKGGFVSISGEIAKAGAYPLVPGMSLEDLIIAAGKMTLIADLEKIELARANGAKETINLPERLAKGAQGRVVMEAGDLVVIPRAPSMVILIGAIPAPGPRPLKPGQTLKDFFTSGQTETLAALDDSKVDLGKAQLIRQGEPSRKVELRRVLRGDKREENVELKEGDVIFLPGRKEPGRTATDYLRALPFIGSLLSFVP